MIQSRIFNALIFFCCLFINHLSLWCADEAQIAKEVVDTLLKERPSLPEVVEEPSKQTLRHWFIDLPHHHPELAQRFDVNSKTIMAAVIRELMARDDAYATTWANDLKSKFAIDEPNQEKLIDSFEKTQSMENRMELLCLFKGALSEKVTRHLIKWLGMAYRTETDFVLVHELMLKLRDSGIEKVDPAVEELLKTHEIKPSEAVYIRTRLLTPKAMPDLLTEWRNYKLQKNEVENDLKKYSNDTSYESLYDRFGNVGFYFAKSRNIEGFQILLEWMQSDFDQVRDWAFKLAKGYAGHPESEKPEEWGIWYNKIKASGAKEMPEWTEPKRERNLPKKSKRPAGDSMYLQPVEKGSPLSGE